MTTDELKRRTKSFALQVTRLVDALPNTVKGRAIANQIMRSAWFELILDTDLCGESQIERLLKEAGELIMAASRKSAIGNRESEI
jgi:hypothetical protein